MKHFTLVVVSSITLALVGSASTSARSNGIPAIARIARIVEASGDHRVERVGDSLVVSNRRTGWTICTVRVLSGSIVEIVGGSTIALPESHDRSFVDLDYLDCAAIGTVSIDGRTGRWELSHRFDSERSTDIVIESLFRRFVAAVTGLTKRFDSTLTDVR